MRIGIDLDNTLADYAQPFGRLCREFGVDPLAQSPKNALRGFLRSNGRESEWTQLQGEVYGPRMVEATLAAGAMEFLEQAACCGADCFVVSHRTRHPIQGDRHDLHACARAWLVQVGLDRLPVFLEESTALKLARIRLLELNAFIDDLPEFLREDAFPPTVRRLLVVSRETTSGPPPDLAGGSWGELSRLVFP